jgi:signal transduction histidine kinase
MNPADEKLIGSPVFLTSLEEQQINNDTDKVQELLENPEKDILLKNILESISRNTEKKTTLKEICQEILTFFKTDRVHFYELDQNAEHCRILTEATRLNHQTTDQMPQYSEKHPNSSSYEFFNNNHVIVINNIEQDTTPADCKQFYKDKGIKSILSLPLRHETEHRYRITLFQESFARVWTIEEVELLHLITEYLYVALRQQETYLKLSKRIEREAFIRKIIDTIRGSLDIQNVKNNLTREVGKWFNADVCYLRMVKDEKQILTGKNNCTEYIADPETPSTIDKIFPKMAESFVMSVYRNNENILLPDTSLTGDLINDDCESYLLNSMNAKSTYGLPIFIDGKLEAIFVLHYIKNKKNLSDEDIQLLQIVIDNAAIALKKAMLFKYAQNAIKEKDDYIATISHELRTPLQTIIGFVELILMTENDNLSDHIREYLNISLKNSKYMLKLVNDLLEISKMDAGKLELQYKTFSPKTIIEEIIESMANKLDEKNIKINLHLTDLMLSADPERYRQIIFNLLGNAVKYTPENGSITISIKAENDNIITSVEDTGIGISEDFMHKVFNIFECEIVDNVKQDESSGVGLSITQKLVKLHGGEIFVESILGKGSKFWFTLPASVN